MGCSPASATGVNRQKPEIAAGELGAEAGTFDGILFRHQHIPGRQIGFDISMVIGKGMWNRVDTQLGKLGKKALRMANAGDGMRRICVNLTGKMRRGHAPIRLRRD